MAIVLNPLRQAQPEGIELIQRSYLEWLESQEGELFSGYVEKRDYYSGDHQTQLTKRMRKFLELRADQDFQINVCGLVVDALAEKLKVARFDCGKDTKQADTLAQWWDDNRMDAQQAIVHLAAVRDGDTYVLVEWDNEAARPRYTFEAAYDGSEGVHVFYSDERRLEAVVAIKRWTVTSGQSIKTRRENRYYPDRVEKYTDLGTGLAWQHHEEEGKPWPAPWTDTGREDGGPLGIPVIHFRNRDQGKSQGQSELDAAIPLQNAGNKALIDLLGAADTTGFQMVYATGISLEDPVIVAPGSILKSTSPDAKFGTLTPATLDDLIALKDSIIADIGKTTRTPLSFFQLTGQVASEGTQKEQRAGLIAKAADRQVTFGNAWEDVQVFARKLNEVFGPGGLELETRISTVWEDDEKPEPKELAEQVELLTRAEAASTQTKVQILHPDWSEKQIAAEVALILAETGQAVPEIGAVA